jgi:hypothetical protein
VLFPPDVPMVPSSVFIAATGSEHLSCDGFSLGETISFGNLEFIADLFGGLSLSPLRDGSGVIIMGPTHCEPQLLQHTMTGDPTEGFPTTPNGEGRIDLPFLGRHNMKAPPTSTTTIPRPGNSRADQATMTIRAQQETPRPDANLPLERWCSCREAAKQRSELAGGQAAIAAGPCKPLQHEPPAEERILMMNYVTTRARSEGVPSTPVVDGTQPRLPWPFHLRPPLTRWIGFTAS